MTEPLDPITAAQAVTVDGNVIEQLRLIADENASRAPIAAATGRDGNIPDLLIFVHRDDQTLEQVDLERYQPVPYRKTGHVQLADADSLVEYVNRHADPVGTTLWGDVGAGRVVAVIDDHGKLHTGAGWGQHRATLTLVATQDWTHWTRNDGKLFGQVDFAQHLEDGAEAVRIPSAADLVEIAQSFHAKRGVAFKSSNRLASGEVQFLYEETTTAKAGQRGDMTVPDTFELGLAPFEGCDPYRVVARFRYRLGADGTLQLGYRLVRPDLIRRSAFGDVVKAVAEGCGLPVMAGTPRS